MWRSLGIAAAVCAILLAGGCGGGDGSPPAEGNGGPAVITETTFEVNYAKDAVVVSEDVAARIERIEDDRLVFDGEIRQVRELPKGKPVLFEGKTLRTITDVREEGGKLVALTEPATLNELIEEGTIAWTQDFRWDAVFAAHRGSGTGGIQAWFFDRALAQDGADIGSFKGEIAGWDVSLALRPDSAGERLNIELVAGKPNIGAVRASGHISRFTAEGEIVYDDGDLRLFSYTERGLEGEIEIQFAGVEVGTAIRTMDIPFSVHFPFRVGPIPVGVKLEVKLRVVPENIPGTSSQGHFRVRFRTDRGFTFEPGSGVRSVGAPTEYEEEVAGETVSAGFVPTAMGAGLEFPRMALEVLGETVVPYLAIDTYAWSLYIPFPACQQGGLRMRAIAGLSLGFFGFSWERETELWKRERIWELEGSKC